MGKSSDTTVVHGKVLKECPFCGGIANGYEVVQQDGTKQYLIVCDVCKGAGPLCALPESAATAWNRRAGTGPEAPAEGHA